LQLPATNTEYLVKFKGHRKLVTICGKFAVVSRGIWQTGPRNLEKFATENCGPYSLEAPRTHHRLRIGECVVRPLSWIFSYLWPAC